MDAPSKACSVGGIMINLMGRTTAWRQPPRGSLGLFIRTMFDAAFKNSYLEGLSDLQKGQMETAGFWWHIFRHHPPPHHPIPTPPPKAKAPPGSSTGSAPPQSSRSIHTRTFQARGHKSDPKLSYRGKPSNAKAQAQLFLGGSKWEAAGLTGRKSSKHFGDSE